MTENKKKGIAASAIQVSFVVLIIKFLGVFKQAVIAATCGATYETDAYFIASSLIMNLSTTIFSALSISLLTLHTERLTKYGRESSNNLINAVLGRFVPISALISLLFALLAPYIATVFAPSYRQEQLTALIVDIRIMAPMFVFMCYYLIMNVVLETDKRFLPGKGQGFFLNLFIIIAALSFYHSFGIQALLVAFLAAGFVQSVQITWNARNIFHFDWKTKPEKETINQLIKLVIPLFVGNAIYEINDIVDKQISSGLSAGSVSYLTYGASINEIVTTLIVTSVTTVLFSHFATWAAQGEHEKISKNLKSSLDYLAVLIAPAMIICFVCGDEIVGILYGRGHFDSTSISMTSSVVMGYASGFFFQAARANIVKVYYAYKDTRIPMINGAISVSINILLSFILSRYLGVAGIAYATSISMFLVTVLLIPKLHKYIPSFSIRDSIPELIKVIGSSIIACGMALVIKYFIHANLYMTFVIVGIAVLFSYCVVLVLLKHKRAMQLFTKLMKKTDL